MKSSTEFSDQKEDFYIIIQEINLLLPRVCLPENLEIFCIQLVVEEKELLIEKDWDWSITLISPTRSQRNLLVSSNFKNNKEYKRA